MIRKIATLIPKYAFFNKTPKKTFMEQLEDAVKVAPPIGYHIEQIRKQNQNKPKLLPPKKDDKLTVVLQLDEVLIYTFTPDEEGYLLAPFRKYDFYRQLDDYDALMSIYKRRNLDNFINYISQQCQAVIFSAGVPVYVNLIMDLIDPQHKIKHVFNQQQCSRLIIQQQQLDEFQKDLQLLGRDLSRVIYIDSKPLTFWMYPDNCLPMEQFKADQTMKDQDLNLLILELEEYRKQKDVRTKLAKFGIRQVLKDAKMID